MDRRTVLAVILSVIVITIGFSLQGIFFEDPAMDEPFPDAEAPDVEAEDPDPDAEPTEPEEPEVIALPDDDVATEPITYESDLFHITFDPHGARVTSAQLLRHQDGDEPVNMVLAGESDEGAFEMGFGSPEFDPIREPFRFEKVDEHTYRFERDFAIRGEEDEPFTVRKSYRFHPDEYLFFLKIDFVHSVTKNIPVDLDGYAYTLSYGPQIGPEFDELDGRNEFRRFNTLIRGSRDNYDLSIGEREIVTERVDWAAIAGKYFAAIGVPDATRYTLSFETISVPGLEQGSRMSFSRPVISSQSNTDTFRFYLGPKSPDQLGRYDSATDNAFGERGLQLDEAMDTRFMLGWLENILKWGLNLFYGLVPNYGIAIIILTIVVKLALFPLTRKSMHSMRRMQELQPKIEELKQKYKNDQQKLNKAMADLYKQEGVNPLGGCLPMLLQFPFFIAMFGLFHNHFELRGASFIPGWIDDLSVPESILSFEGGLPLLGWSDLRLLPILLVTTQIISSKFMQPASSASSGKQTKMLMYMFPVIIFFVLYNMPAGLLVYWIVTNVIMSAQQWFLRRRHAGEPTKAPAK